MGSAGSFYNWRNLNVNYESITKSELPIARNVPRFSQLTRANTLVLRKRPDGQGASLEITLERLRKRGWEGESRLGVRVTSTQARASRTSVRHFF